MTDSENSDQTGLESEITLGLSPLQFDLLSFQVSLSYPICRYHGLVNSNSIFLPLTSTIDFFFLSLRISKAQFQIQFDLGKLLDIILAFEIFFFDF